MHDLPTPESPRSKILKTWSLKININYTNRD